MSVVVLFVVNQSECADAMAYSHGEPRPGKVANPLLESQVVNMRDGNMMVLLDHLLNVVIILTTPSLLLVTVLTTSRSWP